MKKAIFWIAVAFTTIALVIPLILREFSYNMVEWMNNIDDKVSEAFRKLEKWAYNYTKQEEY